MDTVIKGFLGMFILVLITYTAVGTISAELDASAARSYMDDAKKEVAESNLSSSVIDAVGNQASANGYKMKVSTYGDMGIKTVEYGSGRSIGNTSGVESVEIQMIYQYKIPLLGVKNEHVERGYVN